MSGSFTNHQAIDDLLPCAEPGRRAARRLVWRWMASCVQGYLAAITERRRLRRAMRDLANMDDRMLRDIGIGRSEIPRVVRHGRGHVDLRP